MQKDEVYSLIKEYANNQSLEITDDMDLFKDLQYDSLRFIEFIAEVEKIIGREFDDIDFLFDKVESVGALCEYIMGR